MSPLSPYKGVPPPPPGGQFLPDQWEINTLDLQLNVMIFQEDFLRVNGFPF